MFFSCTTCGTRLELPDEQAAHRVLKVRCSACSAVMTVRSKAPVEAAAAGWYVAIGGARRGPFTAAQLRVFVRAERMDVRTLTWTQGLDRWRPAGEIAALAPLFAGPPPLPAPPPLPGEAGAGAETETVAEAGAGAGAEAGAQAGARAETETLAVSETETVSETLAVSETETLAVSETVSETETETEAVAAPVSETETETAPLWIVPEAGSSQRPALTRTPAFATVTRLAPTSAPSLTLTPEPPTAPEPEPASSPRPAPALNAGLDRAPASVATTAAPREDPFAGFEVDDELVPAYGDQPRVPRLLAERALWGWGAVALVALVAIVLVVVVDSPPEVVVPAAPVVTHTPWHVAARRTPVGPAPAPIPRASPAVVAAAAPPEAAPAPAPASSPLRPAATRPVTSPLTIPAPTPRRAPDPMSAERFAELTRDEVGKSETRVAPAPDPAPRADAPSPEALARAVAAAFGNKKAQFAKCGDQLQERVEVTFTVSSTGKTVDTRVSGTRSDVKAACVRAIVARSIFPAGDQAQAYRQTLLL